MDGARTLDGHDSQRGTRAIPRTGYELVRSTLLDPDTAVTVEAFTSAVWPHFETASLRLADPFDGAIVATARALDAPLVSYDAAIAAAHLVDVIW